uniref:hypothetical protein n=1 Tax=Clostridium sp. NkU-1 TaxID=1095009 RepID=UPI0006D18144
MKKSIIVTVLAVSMLTACGTKTTEVPGQNVITTESVTTNGSNAQNETEEQAVTKAIVEVEEQEIYNQDGVKVTVKGFDQDADGPYLNVLVENDTDKNITVQTRKSSLNGYMVDFTFSCEVAPGKKANDKILMDLTSIDISGIGKIYDIEFCLSISDEYFIPIAESDMIHLIRNLSEPYTQTYDDSGTIVCDQKNIKVVWKDFASDDHYSALLFYIENNSDEEITVQVRDTSVDGFMVDPTMSIDVLPGKKAVDTMTIYNSDLKSNGITDIKSLETSFHISSSDFTRTVVDTEPITIELN